MKLKGNKKKIIIALIIVIFIVIITAIVFGINNKGKKEVSNYFNEQDSVDDTYLKMAKEVWKQEERLLNAVKDGDIETLVKSFSDVDNVMDDFKDNPDQEFVEAASEYLKFMYADLTWTEPDEETYKEWAIDLEKSVNEKLEGKGYNSDKIIIDIDDFVTGKDFNNVYSTYKELYPNASGEWSNETTGEAYEKLGTVLDKIPTEKLYLDIDIYDFDRSGNFTLGCRELLEGTEIEFFDISYWLKDRYGEDSWVGHFIMEEVLD